MAATFNPQAAADQARNAFTVIVLGAIFVLATAHVAASDPAPAYNCGDRGVSYCIVRYSYPCATESGPIGLAANALIKADCSFNWRDQEHLVHSHAPTVPVIVRTIDDVDFERLRAAGATEVVPEAIEGSLMLASHALALVGVPMRRVLRVVQQQRDARYGLLRGYFHGADDDTVEELEQARLLSVTLPATSASVDRALGEQALSGRGVTVVSLRRASGAVLKPDDALALKAGDTLVLSDCRNGSRWSKQRCSSRPDARRRRGAQVIGACLDRVARIRVAITAPAARSSLSASAGERWASSSMRGPRKAQTTHGVIASTRSARRSPRAGRRPLNAPVISPSAAHAPGAAPRRTGRARRRAGRRVRCAQRRCASRARKRLHVARAGDEHAFGRGCQPARASRALAQRVEAVAGAGPTATGRRRLGRNAAGRARGRLVVDVQRAAAWRAGRRAAIARLVGLVAGVVARASGRAGTAPRRRADLVPVRSMPMRSTSSAARRAQAGGVDHVQRDAFDLDRLADLVARGAGDRRDDGQLGAGQRVQQRALADVGLAGQHDVQALAQQRALARALANTASSASTMPASWPRASARLEEVDLLFREVERGLDQHAQVDQSASTSACDLLRERAGQRPRRRSRGGLGAGVDQVGDGLGLGQVELVVEEGAAR